MSKKLRTVRLTDRKTFENGGRYPYHYTDVVDHYQDGDFYVIERELSTVKVLLASADILDIEDFGVTQ